MHTSQYKKSRIWKMKDDKYTKSLAKNKVCVKIHQLRPQGFSLKKWVGPHPFFKGKSPGYEVDNSYARYSETRFTQIYKVFLWRRHVGVALRETNRNISFWCVNSSESAPVRVELIKIKIIFILRQGMSPAKCASRKSLEIQASSVAKRRTLSYRKFV